MADNKKYYYIRLKENFFESDSIILLESQQDGYLYNNILMKMYLKSLKNNGKLMLNDAIPYDVNMIATITRHQVGTVEKALVLFEQLGLIDKLSNGAIYMSDIELMIGKSSTEGDRKRLARATLGHLSDIRQPKIEIELDKDIELDKELKKKKDYVKLLNPLTEENIKRVKLTQEEYDKLYSKYGTRLNDMIFKMDNYCIANGKSYKNYPMAIHNWFSKENSNGNTKVRAGSFAELARNNKK